MWNGTDIIELSIRSEEHTFGWYLYIIFQILIIAIQNIMILTKELVWQKMAFVDLTVDVLTLLVITNVFALKAGLESAAK